MKFAPVLTILMVASLAGCAATPPSQTLARPSPKFSPQAFFSGKTVGEGTLDVVFSRPSHTHVEGLGEVKKNGTLILVQRVKEGDKPPRTRTWHIRPVGGGNFQGTLSDAKGPISADVRGNLLHIRFTGKDGLENEQWLYLQPGGRVARNRLVVSKFGIRLATLDEIITKKN